MLMFCCCGALLLSLGDAPPQKPGYKSDQVVQPQMAPLRVSAGDIEIKPASNVDEQLFALRMLETMYETWPTDASDQKTFVNGSR